MTTISRINSARGSDTSTRGPHAHGPVLGELRRIDAGGRGLQEPDPGIEVLQEFRGRVPRRLRLTTGDVQFRCRENARAVRGDVGDVGGERGERPRLLVRPPLAVSGRVTLEQPARGGHLAVEVYQKIRHGNRHRSAHPAHATMVPAMKFAAIVIASAVFLG